MPIACRAPRNSPKRSYQSERLADIADSDGKYIFHQKLGLMNRAIKNNVILGKRKRKKVGNIVEKENKGILFEN